MSDKRQQLIDDIIEDELNCKTSGDLINYYTWTRLQELQERSDEELEDILEYGDD